MGISPAIHPPMHPHRGIFRAGRGYLAFAQEKTLTEREVFLIFLLILAAICDILTLIEMFERNTLS